MPRSSSYQAAPRTPALGDGFFEVATPAKFPALTLRVRNQPWAERLGLGTLSDEEWLAHFARFAPLPDNLPAPLALGYHGHQFGQYNPALGDGRGFLYAQLRDPVDGRLLDLGTKGSGTTRWSRGHDGRLTLKGGVREVLATEMLEALGVYTSKSFSLVETHEQLQRSDEPSPTRSSVLVRLSHSHVRFGSFQRLAYQKDSARLRQLVEFSIENYYPSLAGADDPIYALFRAVCHRAATLAASWMASGFVHGVLNTDNMNITGESFDYGPYRFLPRYDLKFTAAYFDSSGLYAYGRQPEAVVWNLLRFAEALSSLCPMDQLRLALIDWEARYLRAFHLAFLERLGVTSRDPVHDSLLVSRALCFLQECELGFDRLFFDWYGGLPSEARALAGTAGPLYRGARWDGVRALLGEHAPAHAERLSDAYFARTQPTSLIIDELEALWAPIAARDDWSLFYAKLDEIRALARLYGRAPA